MHCGLLTGWKVGEWSPAAWPGRGHCRPAQRQAAIQRLEPKRCPAWRRPENRTLRRKCRPARRQTRSAAARNQSKPTTAQPTPRALEIFREISTWRRSSSDSRASCVVWWAVQDSNLRPPACKAGRSKPSELNRPRVPGWGSGNRFRHQRGLPKQVEFRRMKWCAWRDSNPRPLPPQGSALSAELQARDGTFRCIHGAEGGI